MRERGQTRHIEEIARIGVKKSSNTLLVYKKELEPNLNPIRPGDLRSVDMGDF